MDPEVKKAVYDVCRAADSLGTKIVLVGGLFSEFTGEIGPGFPPFTKTNDADFAVYVENWATFQKLKDALQQRGFQQQLNIEHRLEHYASGGGDDRRYHLAERLGQEIPWETAGAILLGNEVRKLAKRDSSQIVEKFILASSDPYSAFVDALMAGKIHESELVRAKMSTLVASFGKGFEMST